MKDTLDRSTLLYSFQPYWATPKRQPSPSSIPCSCIEVTRLLLIFNTFLQVFSDTPVGALGQILGAGYRDVLHFCTRIPHCFIWGLFTLHRTFHAIEDAIFVQCSRVMEIQSISFYDCCVWLSHSDPMMAHKQHQQILPPCCLTLSHTVCTTLNILPNYRSQCAAPPWSWQRNHHSPTWSGIATKDWWAPRITVTHTVSQCDHSGIYQIIYEILV